MALGSVHVPAVLASLDVTHFAGGTHAGPFAVSHPAPFAAAARHVPVTGAAGPASAPASSGPASTTGSTHVPLAEQRAMPPFTCPHVAAAATTVS